MYYNKIPPFFTQPMSDNAQANIHHDFAWSIEINKRAKKNVVICTSTPAQLKAHQMKLKISQMYRMSATELYHASHCHWLMLCAAAKLQQILLFYYPFCHLISFNCRILLPTIIILWYNNKMQSLLLSTIHCAGQTLGFDVKRKSDKEDFFAV